MQDLRISFLQSEILWEDPEGNRSRFEKQIKKLPDGNDLIVLPEMFNTGFPVDPYAYAEEAEGPTFEWMYRISAETGSVVTGSLMIEDDERYYNCLVWMDPSGDYQTYYKRHVFHLGEESEFISKGSRRIICELKGWKICPMICYDLRFPVWVKNTFRNGEYEYDLLIFVANWPEIRNHPWKHLLVARAMENQSYVLGVNRVGTDDKGMSYSGDSMLVAADGKVIKACKSSVEESVTEKLSIQSLQDFRRSFNVGADWDDLTAKGAKSR